ncbi:nicotinate-nucleotide adenylyltransferase [Miniphocaeibacter halophilus]|uniref:Nicotinate (Nicotinamide) nucleotide adenylyltransferase n=1 Tax=Miniphocaeibacter halophilus TaxID=2931922 RepID=A0AC61MNW9_9FIRM|nr:nicotinate-nucleotide adenylyltransferase [Miniphocaeibacter halophilus]QQK07161.1 nicotinate (nicotinamide) nucleotide adenylyltransferase [Miniphocaeibacter halophilus]
MRRKLNCQNKKIGIMGGTFDPIHIGHLVMAQEALEFKNLDRIIFIPAGFPPHKNKEITSGQKRLEMVNLAIKGNEKFIVLDYEVKKETKSYSMETIEYIKEIYEDFGIYFIMGEDSFMNIEKWYKYEEFLSEVTVLVARRSFDKLTALREKIKKINLHGYFVEEIPTAFLDISSTNIRRKFNLKKNPRYYLPEKVYDYILKEGLYV